MRISVSAAVVSAALVFLASGPARAEMVKFKAHLNAAAETPPNDSKAVGDVVATLDTATGKLNWNGSYSGLTGPELMSHFHGPGAPGASAPVAVQANGKASPFAGSATLTEAQAADLMAGKWYFNVHTEKNRGGEIRGQLQKAM